MTRLLLKAVALTLALSWGWRAIADSNTPTTSPETGLLSQHSDGNASADIETANRQFENKDYTTAAQSYQDIIVEKGFSAPLCYDLGNALFKAGQIGPAILQYERARYFDPWNGDIDNNLQLARKAAGLDSNSFKWWQVMIRVIPINVWLWFVEGGFVIFTVTILFSTWVVPLLSGSIAKTAKLFVRSVVFFGTPIFLFIILFATFAYAYNLRDTAEGVVIIKDPPLFISPLESAQKVDVLPEGDVVTVEQHVGSFMQVDARDRKFGWIRASSVESIVPKSF